MRSPSVKRLIETFNITRPQAKLIKELCKAVSSEAVLQDLIERRCPATHAYAKSCYNSPFHSRMWRTTLVLHAVDDIIGTYGVEPLGKGAPPDYIMQYEYCNPGDPYSATLIYNRTTDNLYIGCWGTVAERLSQKECE